jgi:hypothetical protein
LKNRHIEDIRGQQLAYNTHLDTIRADHERALTLEIEKQTIQNQSNLGEFLRIIYSVYVCVYFRTITKGFKSNAFK